MGGVTTVYIAGVFEFIEAGTTDKITKYYAPRGFPNALRRSGYGVEDGVFYTLRDHLNSSSGIIVVQSLSLSIAQSHLSVNQLRRQCLFCGFGLQGEKLFLVAQLQVIDLAIETTLRQQFGMATALDNTPVVQH